MRIAILDKITGEWAKPWAISWLIGGIIGLFYVFWQTTEHLPKDWFYLGVSIVGLICVVSLGFRRNLLGNGFGMLATAGEFFVQWRAGAVGLMLTALFNFFTHVYGMFYWAKNSDGDGNMIPKSANKWAWLVAVGFILAGLFLFPIINDQMADKGFLPTRDSQYYWLNVSAFVVAITAQITMILRYSFSWWLWIVSNFIFLAVNLISHNYIFALQTMIYQINAVVGLYEWYRSEQDAKVTG